MRYRAVRSLVALSVAMCAVSVAQRALCGEDTSNCVAPNCTVNLDSGPCVSCLTSNSPCIDLCGDATCSVINIGGESCCAATNCAINVAQRALCGEGTSNCVAPNCTVNLDSGPCVSCLTSNSPCIDLCGDATCSVINIGGESDCASTNCAISVAQIDGCASNCVESVAANPGAESSAPINWCTSRATAVQLALNSGKLILLLAGRTTCPNCEYMRYTVCEVASVRQIIDDNFICWFCPIDDSTEWNVYIPTNIVTVYLPVICVIDPGAPTARLDGTMNIQYEAAFLARLAAHLPTQPPLVRSLTVQNGQVKVGWQGAVGYTNRVLRTTALTGNWTMVGAATPGNGTTITNTSPLSGGSAFFRVMGFK